MRSGVIGRRFATMACGVMTLLAGCDGASEDASPTSGGTTSATGALTERTTVPADRGGAAPAPTTGTPAITASGSSAATGSDGPPATVSQSPAPAKDAFWDPCSLPESDITAAGLNPASKSRISDSTYPTWQMCKWLSADQTFELVIASSDRTIDDLLEPGTYQDLRRTEYYGRQIVQYRSVADTNKIACDFGTPATFGSIVFAYRTAGGKPNGTDTCAKGNEVGARLFRSLP
ncbi:DUF3558 family protein [Nocardia aurantiaca]|nr:DUF3558 family protein [Nocardia aurantiaca]